LGELFTVTAKDAKEVESLGEFNAADKSRFDRHLKEKHILGLERKISVRLGFGRRLDLN